MTTAVRSHGGLSASRLGFRAGSGLWDVWEFEDVRLVDGASPFSLRLAGEVLEAFVFEDRQGTLVPGGFRDVLTYSAVSTAGRIFRVKQIFQAQGARLERSLEVSGPANEEIHAVELRCTGLETVDSGPLVTVPMARSRPALAAPAICARPEDLLEDADGFPLKASGLDIGMATALFEIPSAGLSWSVQPLPDECPVTLRVSGLGGRLALAHEFECGRRLRAGCGETVARQVFHVRRGPAANLPPVVSSEWAGAGFTVPPDRPEWAAQANILEADPRFFGTFGALEGRLDEIRATGFNTVYLLPWHRGHWNGYGTYRYDEIEPSFGTLEDLRSFTDAAHARGMRVLFDLLVNVAGEDSPYPAEHPDWFYRDAGGRILRHRTWNSWCFDPASPGFRTFLTDYAVRCCREWGADGFRVDAAAYRGPNWNNMEGVEPHAHSHAVFTLLEEIRMAVRGVRPEAICLAECFGPAQVPASDVVAYQWVAWLDWIAEALLAGKLSGPDVSGILAAHFGCMPPGTWLCGYTHTHDSVAFQKRELDGPPVQTLFHVLALLCPAMMVFSGGWKMRARPGNEKERSAYRRIFAARSLLGPAASDQIVFESDASRLVARRPSNAGPVKVLANFSMSPVEFEGGALFRTSGESGRSLDPFEVAVVPA